MSAPTDVPPVQDRRRPPFCYQTHEALAAIRHHFTKGGRVATAVSIYVALTEAANRAGGAGARSGFRAARKDIAAAAGCSPDTLDRYVPELVAAGVLEVERIMVEGVPGPNRWVLVEPHGSVAENPPSRTGAARGSRAGAATRARQGSELKKRGGVANAPPPSAPDDVPPSAPPVHLVDTGGDRPRNLPFDAVAEACGVDAASPRASLIAEALNTSKRGKRLPGIRDLFLLELHRWADGPGGIGDVDLTNRLADNPEMFERALARTVARKAALYRERMPGAFLTPTALRNHWLDLELQPERKDGGLTPGQIATWGQP